MINRVPGVPVARSLFRGSHPNGGFIPIALTETRPFVVLRVEDGVNYRLSFTRQQYDFLKNGNNFTVSPLPQHWMENSGCGDLDVAVIDQESNVVYFARKDLERLPETIELPAEQLAGPTTIPQALYDFVRTGKSGQVEIAPPSLAGAVPHLDTAREAAFKEGLSVFNNGGGIIGIKPTEWGETMYGAPRGPETLIAYEGWKREVFSGEIADDERISQIQNLLAQYDLDLAIGRSGISIEAANLFESILKLLPQSLLQSGKDYLKGFVLNSSRIGAARISAYNEGKVCLYPFVLDNYWHLPGIMVHEIGHSTGVRVLGDKDNRVPPDENIPEEVRKCFIAALRPLRTNLDRFLVDYVYGREMRLGYVGGDNHELIADLHVMYMYNGQAIRDFIATDDYSSDEVTSWRIAYNFLKHHVFGGREY